MAAGSSNPRQGGSPLCTHLTLALSIFVQSKDCSVVYLLIQPQPSSLQHKLRTDGAASTAGVGFSSPKSAVKCIHANFCRAQPCFSVGKAERYLCQSSRPAVVDGGARKSCRCACRAQGGFGQQSSQPAALPPSWHSKPNCPSPALHSAFPGFSPGLGKGLWHWQGLGTGHYRL